VPAPTTPPFWTRTSTAAAAGFVLALVVRLVVLVHAPQGYSFDAFQRWGGRDWLLVQGWLPATQLVIHTVAALGFGPLVARGALAVVASIGVAAGCAAAGGIGGPVAAWSFVIAATYGPFVVWSAALYQEGTFLAVIFTALALALRGRLVAADLVIGLAGLVRYEGWPCVAIWLLWRREPRSLASVWGIAVWLAGRYLLGWRGHAASPVDFDDWEGLADRLHPESWLHDAGRLLHVAQLGGGLAYGVVAMVGVAWWRRDSRVWLLLAWLASQVLVTAAWLAGLEVATQRLLVIPVVLSGFLGCLAVARAWERWPRLRAPLVTGMVLLFSLGVIDAWRQSGFEEERLRPEIDALARMSAECPDCVWWVEPRTGLGTRSRHDGCEVLQGISTLRHGRELWCEPWVPAEEVHARRVAATGTVRWRVNAYVVSVEPPG
jgi:hypothetical protein